MKKYPIPTLIYGTCNWARLLLDELSRDSRYRIVGITCDTEYFNADEFCGYPLYEFDGIEKVFPPEQVQILACGIYASPRRRAGYYARAKQKNYTCANFISLKAIVSPTAELGENNFIFGGTYIDHRCRLGNNNVIRPNVYIGHESVIADNVFISPGCNIASRCTIGELSMIGIGSTLIGNLKIGKEVLIGAGAVVTDDAADRGKYLGVPARRITEIDPETGIWMGK